MHLRAEGRTRLFIVKIAKERIGLRVVNGPPAQAVGQHAGQRALAHADGTFNSNITRGLIVHDAFRTMSGSVRSASRSCTRRPVRGSRASGAISHRGSSTKRRAASRGWGIVSSVAV